MESEELARGRREEERGEEEEGGGTHVPGGGGFLTLFQITKICGQRKDIFM